MGSPHNMNFQQEMFMQQQINQQPQTQQQLKNSLQQQAQNQMNTLRQQAQQQNLQLNAGNSSGPSTQNSPAGPWQQQQQQQPQASRGHASPFPNGPPNNQFVPAGPGGNGGNPNAQARGQNNNQPIRGQAGVKGRNTGPNGKLAISNANTKAPPGANAPNGRNSNALQDYQNQLMLLEKQNKKRLEIARNNGSDSNLTASNGPGPGQQQQQDSMNSQSQSLHTTPAMFSAAPPQFNQKPSPATTNSSPLINNKPSPAMGNKKPKKESTGRRSRKQSVASTQASTPSNTGVDGKQTPSSQQQGPPSTSQNQPQLQRRGSYTPNVGRKEFTPLTPVSEPVTDNKRNEK